MKKITAILTLSLCCLIPLQAQPQYERNDFTFKTTKIKNADGEIAEVTLGTYVGDKLIKEYFYQLDATISEELANTIGDIFETDINFDGYPDVDIYLGYWGGFANNTQHEALLWDQQQHCFVQPEGYNGIGEPQLDSEKKYIYTVLSAGPDERVTTYYRWQGNKLQKYLENTWAIAGDDDIICFDDMLNLPLQRFDAKLDGRIPVIIAFQRNADNTVAGYIYYPKVKKPAPILIAGTVSQYEGIDYYHLSEYQADGKICGVINLQHQAANGWDDKVEGTWTNPKTEKEYQLTDVICSREAPRWFTKSLLKPESPDNIGREYSFQIWRQGYDSYMGGHITFRAAGKNKVYFDCGNVVNNIAEGSSEQGRPAVLNGNTFDYLNVNECGYGFRATFYPKFVVLTTITDAESLGCFGAHSAFDGIYLKVKQ